LKNECFKWTTFHLKIIETKKPDDYSPSFARDKKKSEKRRSTIWVWFKCKKNNFALGWFSETILGMSLKLHSDDLLSPKTEAKPYSENIIEIRSG
jgi:hypothetical protein